MRLHRARHAVIPLALALGATACEQGLTGLNDNPNAPTTTNPILLFPQGATAVVGQLRGTGADERFTSLWAQHYAEIQYPDDDQYRIRGTTNNNLWNNLYSGGLQDLQFAQVQAEEMGEPELQAPPMILRQWSFGLMTAIWGDIPYSEANQGKDNLFPAYDPQETIFSGMVAELTAATDLLETGGSEDYGAADVVYGGDAVAWQKFSNSLRLRYANWVANADETTAQSWFAAALAASGGIFESNDDNAALEWAGDGTTVNSNPLFSDMVLGRRDDHRVSATMIDTLTSLSDPRLAVYADPAAETGLYTGALNGLTAADALEQGLARTSKIDTRFWEADAPSMLMTYAEVEFILAEAARRGWAGAGDMNTHYQAGIRASMEMYGISDAAITTYLGQPEVALGSGTGPSDEAKIALQKWIALWGQGIEAWTEYRLTGVPVLTPGPASSSAAGGAVPRRLTYPSGEQSVNAANRSIAVDRQGDDRLTTPLWFDEP
jgi:hypothetical protein